jgi:hypothetical protein
LAASAAGTRPVPAAIRRAILRRTVAAWLRRYAVCIVLPDIALVALLDGGDRMLRSRSF